MSNPDRTAQAIGYGALGVVAVVAVVGLLGVLGTVARAVFGP